MKKTILWIIVVVMFLMLSVALYADNSPPDTVLFEECVLDAPSQLSPHLALIGNEFTYSIKETDLTFSNLDLDTERVNMITEFLPVSLNTGKVNVIDKTINLISRQSLKLVDKIMNIESVNLKHSDVG